ncbi:hypothetical protein [Aestuariirhabdus litorea]|uniref:Uncharacterized protein n=1 Tax=Aestuariirhabdus litorea TaxID=2528527 RepID=A0A3P3VPJ6_9GAMM|nr:hypothetical protein [Aestuariirhabdus litorea]RRJ84354.1 hypothetical protein D0544_04400 [Aestuariirhabdus litorea]RWW97577.1 hypothetical protein DZC74_04395 [Endozoicomonadaceae bacterium GTF-13]
MCSIEYCHNSDCGHPFRIEVIGGNLPGMKSLESITCPYCRYTYWVRGRGIFRSFPLTAKQMIDHNRSQGMPLEKAS